MAVSVSNTATQAVAFRRQKALSSPRLPIKSLSLGGQRGIFSFRGRRIAPLIASLHGAGIYPASAALTATTVKSVHARSSFAFCSAMKASKSSSLTLSPFSV